MLAKAVINFAFLYREAVNALTETGKSPFLLGAVGMTVAYGAQGSYLEALNNCGMWYLLLLRKGV